MRITLFRHGVLILLYDYRVVLRAFSRIAYNAHYHQIHLAHFVKINMGIGYMGIYGVVSLRTSVECIVEYFFLFFYLIFLLNSLHSCAMQFTRSYTHFCSNRAPCTHYQYDILYRKYRVVWCVWCGCLTPFCVFFICMLCYIQLIACISGFSE